MELKKKILAACFSSLDEKAKEFEQSLQAIAESIGNETKSSAGDKHETARARMQSEQEQLQRQLSEIEQQRAVLERVSHPLQNTAAFSGSLYETTQGLFFIAIPLGKIKVDDTFVFVLSPGSPLGKLLTGLERHGEFTMNERVYRILNIF